MRAGPPCFIVNPEATGTFTGLSDKIVQVKYRNVVVALGRDAYLDIKLVGKSQFCPNVSVELQKS